VFANRSGIAIALRPLTANGMSPRLANALAVCCSAVHDLGAVRPTFRNWRCSYQNAERFVAFKNKP
jgi:hypothetical protein